jgi:hypothetical protein
MMVDVVRLRFRDNQNVDFRDIEEIRKLIARGEEELASMNEYHASKCSTPLPPLPLFPPSPLPSRPSPLLLSPSITLFLLI